MAEREFPKREIIMLKTHSKPNKVRTENVEVDCTVELGLGQDAAA